MSFGLLTAINLGDIPKIIRRVARGYRGTQTTRYPQAWQVVADRFDEFAVELEALIDTAIANEPKPRRKRVSLDD